MAIPNRQDIVAALAAQYPAEWRKAHNPSGGGPETEAFIRRVAYELHTKVDARFGLNGKRGNYDDISDDVVNWFGEGPGHDPATGSPITVIDVIGGAGGPNPVATWQIIDLPGPGGWVKPEPVGGSGSGGDGYPLPVPPPPPPVLDLTPIINALTEIRARLSVIEATSLAAAHESLNAAVRASEIKTQIENLPSARPCPPYRGRVPKTFGGSSEVTFEPVL